MAILPMVLLGVNGPSPQGFTGFAWWLSWMASIVVISWCVPRRVWDRKYKAFPPDEYQHGFENPLSHLLWGFGVSWASGVAASVLGNILPIPQATQWMLAYSLFVMAMVGVARFWIFLNPEPAKIAPSFAMQSLSSFDYHQVGIAMASRTPDLDSVDERLRHIERAIGTGHRGNIDQRLERIERHIR